VSLQLEDVPQKNLFFFGFGEVRIKVEAFMMIHLMLETSRVVVYAFLCISDVSALI